jgi:GNAT superfamily N-acetyltransferase
VRKLERSDIEVIAKIHLEAFQGFFLSILGSRFLKELYAAILEDRSGIAFVYEEKETILGFVAGTAEPAGFYRRLIERRWWRFGLASIGPVLSRPMIVPRLLRAFNKPDEVTCLDRSGMLMSIAVHPSSQGKGIGRILIDAFLQEALERDLQFVNLTTDKVDNRRTNDFYNQMGFQCNREFVTPEGRWMNEYVIDLYKHFGTPEYSGTSLS